MALIFLKWSLVFLILLFSSISLHCWLKRISYLSLSFFGILHSDGYIFPFLLLPFSSFLFSPICKASSDKHFALLRFFFLRMALVTLSYIMLHSSVHHSSGTLPIRSNPLNLCYLHYIIRGTGVGKIPWRWEQLPIPIFLPGESPWTEEPGRLCSPWDCKSWCPICYWRTVDAITNRSRKSKETEPLWKWHTVMDVSGGENKVWHYKEQYCIGTSNVTSMSQGKLNVIKQMIRVNIDIWRISKLKGQEWVNLIQMTIISTTVGKNPLEEI